MADYWGTRLAVGELSRATTQVAVILATALGHKRAGDARGFRGWASERMFGALSGSILPVRVADFDDHEQPEGWAAKVRRRFEKAHAASRLPLPRCDELTVELVLVPLDGANALRDGHSGALSLIGAARPGSFVGERFTDGEVLAECYLAFVIGKAALTKGTPPSLPLVQPNAVPPEVCTWLEEQKVLDTLVDYVRPKVYIPVIATVHAPSAKDEPRFPLQGCMVRRLDGSSVGAALAALRNKVSATVCICWRPQIKLIALAALGLQGSLSCVPLLGAKFPYHVPCAPLVRRETDFVRGRSAILVSSSISEVCFQDRVRFIGGHRASVNTLVVSLASRSIRDTSQNLDLNSAIFCDVYGQEIVATDELQRFRRNYLGDANGLFGAGPDSDEAVESGLGSTP